jgi:hypothetical protein
MAGERKGRDNGLASPGEMGNRVMFEKSPRILTVYITVVAWSGEAPPTPHRELPGQGSLAEINGASHMRQ